MIKEVKIQNFKSVRDLTVPLSRFNILIGANGSGKSNILEAIAFGGAASADKLDNEFLGSRGIRIATSRLMKSAFIKQTNQEPIKLGFLFGDKNVPFTIFEEEKPILKWIISEKKELEDSITGFSSSLFNQSSPPREIENLEKKDKKKLKNLTKAINTVTEGEAEKDSLNTFLAKFLGKNLTSEIFKEVSYDEQIANFIIYSPELSSLRKFEDEGQIQPIGIKGEGLFNILQIFNENYGPSTIEEIKKYLNIIEWFENFDAHYDNISGRKFLVVNDRYLPEVYLNQTNVNEGFLFLLFYISLFISKETPAFFAIDNIEASFHPRLCEELIKNLVELSKKHNKQVILTTHNPFVLDGLDLNDPDQNLLVVRRNADGETITDKIKQPKKLKLSEAWMRGVIGGQPETF